jgi:8-hydroxy-5-deazaflavin:NADPH oxidoreductase
MGSGLAGHIAKKHDVIIGSRDPARARAAASHVDGATGASYKEAAEGCDVAVIAVPYSAVKSLAEVSEELGGDLVISMVNPLRLGDGLREYGLKSGSAAEEVAAALHKSRVATAFNNIPPSLFRMKELPEVDTLVAADERSTYEEAAAVARCVPGIRPLYAGPLKEARTIEEITPLMLNLAQLNRTGSLAPRFVSAGSRA